MSVSMIDSTGSKAGFWSISNNPLRWEVCFYDDITNGLLKLLDISYPCYYKCFMIQ